MSKKVGNAAVRAERLAEAEAEALGQLAPSTTIVISKVPKRIGDEITLASQKVEVDGDVIVDVPIEEGFGEVKAERINKARAANDAVKAAVKAREEAKGRLSDLGIDQKDTPAFQAVMDEIDDLGVKVDKAREEYDAVLNANKAAEAAPKKRLEKARKDKLKEIRKGIENNPNVKDTVEEVLPDGSVRFTSKKKATAELAEAELNIEGRTFVQRVLASSKRALGSGAGLGQAQKRKRERLDATRNLAERQVRQNFQRLDDSIKKDFNTKAENLDKETLTLIDIGS
jgi:hypothetical protein